MSFAPMKLAIIGGGPSAFYVASRILSLIPLANPVSPPVRVHIYDRLWAPHGLVRYGVAPDHPEVKNCTNKFDAVATDPRFGFFGNVNVGETTTTIPHALQLPLSSVFEHYTHVLFATGCALPNLHPALPPSLYCIPALSLVHWYTQHPSLPTPPPLERLSHISIIGNGNVSLDIARILLTPASLLAKYDVPERVLNVLSRSRVQHVAIVGRRGPLQAAFTTKELREMMNLPDASMVPIEPSLFAHPSDPPLTRQQSRILQLLQKGSKNAPGTTSKTWSLDFFRSPTGLIPPSSDPAMAQLKLDHTSLDPTDLRAMPTGETSTLSTSMVVTSLGFHGEPVSSFYDPALGHVRTLSGRIMSSSGTIVKNAYASGWAATGAKGVLASTMINAYAIADTILTDWMPKGQVANTTVISTTPKQDVVADDVARAVLNPYPHPEDPPPEVLNGLKSHIVTQYKDWKAIDAEEIKRGQILGKERERMEWAEARTEVSQNAQ